MSILRSCRRGLLRPGWGQLPQGAVGLPRLLSSGGSEDLGEVDAQDGTQKQEPRVALPFKWPLDNSRSYPHYLRERWRFKPSDKAKAEDKRVMYRLGNILEYQAIHALKFTTLLQKIVTESVAAKEQLRLRGADAAAVDDFEHCLRKLIGAIVWHRRASRPTFDGLSKFRDNRVKRIQESKQASRQKQEQGAAADGEEWDLEEDRGVAREERRNKRRRSSGAEAQRE